MNIHLDNLESGDIILFSTKKWYSELIEIGDDCIFSHCGIVLRDPTYIDSSLNGLYLLESGLEPFEDVTDHKIHFGVQIVPLIKVINEYILSNEGQIYHRPLFCNRDKQFENRLLEAYQIIKDKPYNINPLDWLEALFGFHWFDQQITSRFWCSALVAYVYVKLEFIENKIAWTMVTPKDWFSGSKSQFVFLNGVHLEKEIPLF